MVKSRVCGSEPRSARTRPTYPSRESREAGMFQIHSLDLLGGPGEAQERQGEVPWKAHLPKVRKMRCWSGLCPFILFVLAVQHANARLSHDSLSGLHSREFISGFCAGRILGGREAFRLQEFRGRRHDEGGGDGSSKGGENWGDLEVTQDAFG